MFPGYVFYNTMYYIQQDIIYLCILQNKCYLYRYISTIVLIKLKLFSGGKKACPGIMVTDGASGGMNELHGSMYINEGFVVFFLFIANCDDLPRSVANFDLLYLTVCITIFRIKQHIHINKLLKSMHIILDWFNLIYDY